MSEISVDPKIQLFGYLINPKDNESKQNNKNLVVMAALELLLGGVSPYSSPLSSTNEESPSPLDCLQSYVDKIEAALKVDQK